MRDLTELERLIDTGTPLVFVDTTDLARVEELAGRLATRSGRPAFRWSLATGLIQVDGGTLVRAVTKPSDVLAHILAAADPALYLLFDLPEFLDEPLVVSQLREVATRRERLGHSVLLAGPELDVPTTLRPHASRIDLALPGPEELKALVLEEAEAIGKARSKRVQATQAAIDAIVRNLTGLSRADARRLIRTAIVDDGVLSEADLPEIRTAKYKLLDQGGVLSFELNPVKIDEVAGLANLKRWLGERRSVFTAEQPLPGLDPPKGVLLLGIQGGGKSLAAKAIAGAWELPLLRLDFATLYNKYYGETERNLRESLRTAGVMAPCILWIDEIEKGLASEGDDGGPGKRLLGTLLTWMAERREKIFLVATANDIESLPPELLRKGRFDEIFFVDLPKPEARQEIFAIHLKKRGQDPAGFDLKQLAEAATGFSGAEIEQAVVSSLYAARAAGAPLDTAAIEKAVTSTRPLSVVMAEKMAYLRAWALERTVLAD